MKHLIKIKRIVLCASLSIVFQNATINAQVKSMESIRKSMQNKVAINKNLKSLPLLNYVTKSKKTEQTTVTNTDCPGTTTTCTVTRASLEAPIFGTSLFTFPTDLFLGNLFDVNEYKNSGVMNPKLVGTRNKISVSASSQAFGGTEVENINPTRNDYMTFLGRARTQLDKLIGDSNPILSAEYVVESISSEDHMKATLGATYNDPQNFFNFQSSVSASSSKQFAVIKFVESNFNVAMDDPAIGLFVSPTTISSTFGFVSNITYGRFVLLMFETSRTDFDLKATLEAGLNVPAAQAGGNASLNLSTVQDKIKVKLIIQGFNANPSYSSLLSGTTINNSIIEKINAIIGGAMGTRSAAIPIIITAKKATLDNFSYPEISQTVTFNNVPVEKSCIVNYPPSAKKYKYEVSFNKIYSTKAAWGFDEQLYGKLYCERVTASKGGETTSSIINFADILKPSQIKIDKEKEYNLKSLINGLETKIITFTKPECISEQEFLRNSYIEMNANLKIVRDPAKDENFDVNSRYKIHRLNSINQIAPYNNFGNTCNATNQGIICTTTPDGQNFQISYSIKKVE
jgi:hypothetical protein